MGDDPIIPDLRSDARSGASSATGMHYEVHHGLSKGQSVFIVSVACLALGIAIGAIVISTINGREAERAERETRMLEYYLLELDAKAIAAGIKRPEDAIANKLKEEKKP